MNTSHVYSLFFNVFCLFLRRGHSSSGNHDKQRPAAAPVKATHVTSRPDEAHDVSNGEEFLKTQDDSVVYSETPNKKHGSKLKGRRVESFK